MQEVIELEDGVKVEVNINENSIHEISANGGVVNSSIDKLQSLLKKVMKPISNTYQELNKDVNIESTKVTVGVKIGIKGDFILASSSADAHIQVEMTLKPISHA